MTNHSRWAVALKEFHQAFSAGLMRHLMHNVLYDLLQFLHQRELPLTKQSCIGFVCPHFAQKNELANPAAAVGLAKKLEEVLPTYLSLL